MSENIHQHENCSCGHDHEHHHHENCSCGHDHEHHHHDHCSCGHDHGKEDSTCICGHDHKAEGGVGHDRSMGRVCFALVGGILTANSFIMNSLLPEQEFAANMSALFGAFILALPIIITAVKDLVRGKVYMNELVALAILAALVKADFQTAGIIAFFLLVTIIIETRTASGAQRSIEELIKLTPNTANLITPDGSEKEVAAQDLKVGDRIRIRPGENFPVDGRIVSGESTVNQASITGESVPVEKVAGEDVFAGTQNLTGAVEVTVTKVGGDTTLGKVKEMIMQAEASRTPVVRIIDRYAGYYTPTVLMVAWITWWFSRDMNSVIAFLVIACPCAVVLATPTAVVAAVAAAARLGIFIKNISHLELASRISAFVFDKTGTLTDGLLSVVKLQGAEGVSPAELLGCAASVERFSNHPTALAIVKLANEAELKLDEVTGFTEVHGRGVSGTANNSIYRVGRANWMRDNGLNVPESDPEEAAGMSVVYVSKDDKVLGWIGFRDKIRKESQVLLSDLRRLGVRYCAMVTGDRQSVAEDVAAQLSIDEFKSGCLPETKVEFVENVKRDHTVAVVGDGVNDAPALAAGDLGIAMGAIGSDIAINSASVALMTNDLRRIAMLIFLAKKSQVIINQNLIFGMLFVFGGMILSIVGLMTPIWAAVIHAGSTLVIVFNSARLVRTGEELTLAEKPETDNKLS
ncbi:MAG: cation-translocating P-type ATPase [Lentisphaerae bacterium]|nr:cation-translocating P-type ATPase [Lentisphaerota bacterium]